MDKVGQCRRWWIVDGEGAEGKGEQGESSWGCGGHVERHLYDSLIALHEVQPRYKGQETWVQPRYRGQETCSER